MLQERYAEQVRELAALGLPVCAARAYISLLQLGDAEARQVSELARIAPTKVYAALAHLEKRGLASIISGKPRKYRPVPIADFVSHRIEEERDAAALMAARVDRLTDIFPIVGEPAPEEGQGVTMLRGRRNLSEHLRRELRNAMRDVCFQLPLHAMDHVSALDGLVAQARARGVRMRLLRPAGAPRGTEAWPPLCDDERFADPRQDLGPDVMLAVFDERAAFLAHFDPSDASRDHAKDIAILTHDGALVRAFATILAQRWDTARASAPRGRRPGMPAFARETHERVPIAKITRTDR